MDFLVHFLQVSSSSSPVLHRFFSSSLQLSSVLLSSPPALHQFSSSSPPALHQLFSSSPPALHQLFSSSPLVLFSSPQFFSSSPTALHQLFSSSPPPVVCKMMIKCIDDCWFTLLWDSKHVHSCHPGFLLCHMTLSTCSHWLEKPTFA